MGNAFTAHLNRRATLPAISIKTSSEKPLSTHQWCIYTTDKITQDVILKYLAKIGKLEESQSHEFIHGELLPVTKVSFEIVMFLKNNRATVPYDFEPYHKDRPSRPWRLWKEGNSTAPPKISVRFVPPDHFSKKKK